jgi:hypothetical protein
LVQHSDDKLSFALKTPWDDGTTHIVLSPLELLEKLAALVPPPRVNLVRYHGVLAPNAKDRDKIVPAGEKTASDPASGAETDRPSLAIIDFLGLRCSPEFSRSMPASASVGVG